MDVSIYDKYKDCRNLAWTVLIQNKLTHFPIDINHLAKSYGINLVQRQKVQAIVSMLNIKADTEAVAIKLNNEYYIIYDPGVLALRLRFSLTHELGHILSGHIQENNVLPKYNEFAETEANIFASRLLAPAIVAKEESLMTAEQVSNFFGISKESAEIRITRLNELYQRNKFLTSPLEREYYNMYLAKKHQ